MEKQMQTELNEKIMNKLMQMAFNYDDPESFAVMFGSKSMGDHLFEKYKNYDRNLMKLYADLDVENKAKFIRFVNNLTDKW